MSKFNLIFNLGLLLIAICWHINTFAAVNPVNLLRSGYLYYDEDIRTVLQAKLDARSVYVAPALAFESQDLVRDIVRDAANEVPNAGDAALIPINFGNAHWAALAIKRNADGSVKAIYNDSMGGPLSAHGANATLLVTELQNRGIQLLDLQLRQQSDGSSCGAFTTENLIKIAETDINGLNDNEIRNLLASINNASAIRQSHFLLLYRGDKIFDVETLKPRSKTTARNLASRHKILANGMDNINKLIHDRLADVGNFSAVAAGDNEPQYGAWVKGFIGSGVDKDNNSADTSSILKNKTTFRGFIIGADTEISDGLTLGVAFSKIGSKSKSKLEDKAINTDTITSNVYSVYGSDYISDDLWLNGNISLGLVSINSKDQLLTGNSTKQKGSLVSGGLTANYKLYSNEYIAVTPRIGSTLNKFTLKGYEDHVIKIAQSKQQTLELSAGTEVASIYNTTYLRLIPKLSADYSYAVWRKGSKIAIDNMIDQNIIQQKISANKGAVKFGAGLTIETDSIEISNGYEYSTQGRNHNHMGYAKFRVNF
jgi:hypothetical protein